MTELFKKENINCFLCHSLCKKFPPPFFRLISPFHPIISAHSGPSRRDEARASVGSVPARRHGALVRRVAVAAVSRRPWRFPRFGEGRGFRASLVRLRRKAKLSRCGPQQGILPSAKGSRKFWPPSGARLPPTKTASASW